MSDGPLFAFMDKNIADDARGASPSIFVCVHTIELIGLIMGKIVLSLK
jgi:hypothetical protein